MFHFTNLYEIKKKIISRKKGLQWLCKKRKRAPTKIEIYASIHEDFHVHLIAQWLLGWGQRFEETKILFIKNRPMYSASLKKKNSINFQFSSILCGLSTGVRECIKKNVINCNVLFSSLYHNWSNQIKWKGVSTRVLWFPFIWWRDNIWTRSVRLHRWGDEPCLKGV